MGIIVNMSDKEAKAAVQEPVPGGWYKVTISDGELKESTSEKNPGKPMYNLEFTINEPSEYEGRKFYTIACLWDGALYTISQLCKSLGYEVDKGQFEIPELDDLMGQEVMSLVKITAERTVEKGGEIKTYERRNEVKGFRKIGAQAVHVPQQRQGQVSSQGASLLP
jgi:hypothetical protein